MNDGGEFEHVFQEIYPPKMELSKENNGNRDASFLDLDIRVTDNKFDVKLFNKKYNFSFLIVRMPHANSNVPSSIFYASIGTEILRISPATTDRNNFFLSSNCFLSRMIKRGAKYATGRKSAETNFWWTQ